MIASPTSRALFVHVQKTGGLTVEALMRQHLPDAKEVTGLSGGKHATMAAALRRDPDLADYWTFGFVRNPWARLYSWWAMIVRRDQTATEGSESVQAKLRRNPFWRKVISDHQTFESFVLLGPDDFGRLRVPQLDYLRTPLRRADFIGRTENFDEDLRAAFEHLGLPPPEQVPRNNAGPPTDYRDHYTPVMRRKVERLFQADIEAFDYSF
ncbi:sulfotransferase family 2 domain-containing protein [Nocardioides sp.]|uniref:sulfotransferase family 2 domain-containing protein n=1 Tax=Nocardioides sp. TaxID=35761 RepID=UPI0031FEBEBC|nr:hypothetical protein [Nocardioides sp.]